MFNKDFEGDAKEDICAGSTGGSSSCLSTDTIGLIQDFLTIPERCSLFRIAKQWDFGKPELRHRITGHLDLRYFTAYRKRTEIMGLLNKYPHTTCLSIATVVPISTIDFMKGLASLTNVRLKELRIYKKWGEAFAVDSALVKQRSLPLSQPSRHRHEDIEKYSSPLSSIERIVLHLTVNFYDCDIEFIATHCPNLRDLYLAKPRYLTDDSLIAIGNHCTRIRSLTVAHAIRISDVGIAAIAKPGLEYLWSYRNWGVTSATKTLLTKHCPKLKLRKNPLIYAKEYRYHTVRKYNIAG